MCNSCSWLIVNCVLLHPNMLQQCVYRRYCMGDSSVLTRSSTATEMKLHNMKLFTDETSVNSRWINWRLRCISQVLFLQDVTFTDCSSAADSCFCRPETSSFLFHLSSLIRFLRTHCTLYWDTPSFKISVKESDCRCNSIILSVKLSYLWQVPQI